MPDPSSLADARRAAAALGASALLGAESVLLDDCPGRIAAEDVAARFALPGFGSSAMDGWAVRAADVSDASDGAPVLLRTAGESRAGAPTDAEVLPGTACRISTGARLPAGADAVVRVEDAEATDGAVAVRVAVAAGRDVRLAGEDVVPGDLAVRSGERLGPGHVALLAGLGVRAVACRRRPRALVVITGDELGSAPDGTAPGEAAPDGEAPDGEARRAAAGRIHDVGGPALAALLRELGAEVVAVRHAEDTAEATVAALTPGDLDLVVSTGGVSVGPHDHVRGALARLGARAHVEALDLQPGRPTWMGALSAGPGSPSADEGRRVVPVLALPGNPGAAITVATLLLIPLLRGMSGRPAAPVVHARLAADERGGRRVRALRVALEEDEDGRRRARVLDGQQAHRLASFPATEAFALILAGEAPLPAGTRVEVVPLPR